MTSLLLSLLLGAGPNVGEIPHLAKNELAVVSEGGGRLGYVGRLVVLRDGSVSFTASIQNGPVAIARWRLTKNELGELRRLVAGTDFPALHRGPRANSAPSAYDAIDRALAVRQGPTARGWTNVRWTEPATPVPLFARLAELRDRSRARIDKGA